jgi:UTP--glucose-1-phosphate uridylyltransferase
VACARKAVGDEAFALLLPDEIMGDSSLLLQMAQMHNATGKTVVGLKRVPKDEVSAYGVITTTGTTGAQGEVTITGVVEKPKVEDAPSDIIIIGRYVLAPDMFDILETLAPAPSGEIQLTDALLIGANAGTVDGVVSDIERHDTGTPMGWLQTVIELTLKRADVGTELRNWLEGIV